ncbi:MAG: ATP-grasp domain-containing protein [Myxococcota bacterium]|nr:ATP-grasp domain-containing protein [Myxococcota bacterium]
MHNLIIFFGGKSGERNVSVASAQNMAQLTERCQCWFWSPDGRVLEVPRDSLLAHQNPFEQEFTPPDYKDLGALHQALPLVPSEGVLFLAVHGGEGENGTLQAALESAGVAFSGSDSQASAKAFDKAVAKDIVARVGLRVPRSITLRGEHLEDAAEQMRGFLQSTQQAVLKPVADGSSFGVHFVRDESTLQAALQELKASPKSPYLFEERIIGRELTVGVLETHEGVRALPCSEVLLATGREFDYAGKYLGDGVQEVTPADIPQSVAAAAQDLAREAHLALKCGGYSRTDIMLDETGLVFIETNTLPGLSSASFIPQQLEAASLKLSDFLQEQIELATRRRDARS